jgi:chemotaxis protein methyltransferase WspC
MAFVKIKNLLKKTMGLSSESIGDSSIERAVNHRKDILKIKNTDAYLSLLVEGSDELDELVEEVVVPETWFFRNIAPFDSLASCSPLRILSLPCSTGEEPYSVAMTLLNMGLKENEFQIDAQDISKRSLRKARRAIYGKHSFREDSKIIIEQYFRKTRSGQQLLPIVRDRVTFIRSNIIKEMIIPEPEYYDVIFCRNLLIYFDRNTQKEVLEKLHFMLKPGGTLFVGHAETAEVDKKYFKKLNKPKSFAYTKKRIGVSQLDTKNANHMDKLTTIYENLIEISKKDAALSKNIKSSNRKNANRDAKKILKEKISWNNIEVLIEQGKFNEVSILCEKRLKTAPDDAQAYYYLALISKMDGGNGSAELLLKKAVYLDPNHHRALKLFWFLAEQRGDKKLAESLRRREDRARKRSGAI